MAAALSAESFFESHCEESNSSEVSCQISSSTCSNGELGGVKGGGDLKALVFSGFRDVFDLDGPMGESVRSSGMQVSMQSKQNSSKSRSVRQGCKLNMAINMDDFGWSDDSDSDSD